MRANPSGGEDIASVVYVMTIHGFNLLVMGFTGPKALAFKLAYIDAFNAMAAQIRNQREGLGYRQARHELACAGSARRGSLHGRGLNQRRLELPRLNAEEKVLLELSQPSLPLQ